MEVTKNLNLVLFDILNSHGYQTTVQMGIWKTTYIFDKNIDYNYLLFFTINLNQCHFIVSFPYSKRKQYLLQRAIIRSFTLMI